MKTRTMCILAAVLLGQVSDIRAQGTAFTYQGQLLSGGLPASGSYDLSFTLYATNTGGTPVAGPLTNLSVAVNGGLFTATLDFGTGIFSGTNYWLQIAVRSSGGGGL